MSGTGGDPYPEMEFPTDVQDPETGNPRDQEQKETQKAKGKKEKEKKRKKKGKEERKKKVNEMIFFYTHRLVPSPTVIREASSSN